jgi:uncharacterized RDD family membrane protein YckC
MMSGTRGSRVVTDVHVNVSPDLVGQPLASPARRFLALAVDYLILFVPSVLVAAGAALLVLWISEPRALRALRVLQFGDSRDAAAVRAAYRDLAPLLARMDAPGMPAAAKAAVEEGDLDGAAELLSQRHLLVALAIGEREEPEPQEETVVFQVEKVIPRYARAVAMWGVAGVYFTLLTRSRRGTTVGKRLLGIRVACLSGGRLGWLDSLERFAGYLEIPATLGFALVSLWHDPNRRLPHDRLAGTVVLRVLKEPAGGQRAEPRSRGAAPATSGATGAGEPASATASPEPGQEGP